MWDKLIFPTSIEQVATGELIHDNFPLTTWTNVAVDINESDLYISDITLDIAPMVFFEWAYQTPAGQGPVLFYCLHLSTEFLLEPAPWMLSIVERLGDAPKQLTDGYSI